MVRKCCTCFKNKENTITKKIGKHYFDFCPECLESLKWTQACLRAGTDKLLEKQPTKFRRVTQFSVTAIE